MHDLSKCLFLKTVPRFPRYFSTVGLSREIAKIAELIRPGLFSGDIETLDWYVDFALCSVRWAVDNNVGEDSIISLDYGSTLLTALILLQQIVCDFLKFFGESLFFGESSFLGKSSFLGEYLFSVFIS